MKKVGIIGCGGIARVHAWALNSVENTELAAYCDVEEGKARELAAYCDVEEEKAMELATPCRQEEAKAKKLSEDGLAGRVRICTDWRELCDLDLDVVHVCTPHFLHVPMAKALLEHGKAVLMEKPCAISVEQFEELKKADALHPGKLGFCFQNRYNGTIKLMDKMVREERIGAILGGRAIVTWRRDEGYYAGSSWKGKWETEGGGALINQSIHTLDLLLRYLGQSAKLPEGPREGQFPEKLSKGSDAGLSVKRSGKIAGVMQPIKLEASMARHHFNDPAIEVEDTVEAWLEFEDGKRGCFYASNAYAADAPVYLELQGERGRIVMNGREVSVYEDGKAPRHYLRDKETGIGKDYWGCGHKACIQDFYKSLAEGKPFQNNLQGVESTFRTAMRIYEKAGRPT